MAKELERGAPALSESDLTENIRLLEEYKVIISEILTHFGLVNEDIIKLGITPETFLLSLTIRPVNYFVFGKDDEPHEFKVSPFEIFVFVSSKTHELGKHTYMTARTLVLTEEGNVTTAPVSLQGDNPLHYDATIKLDKTRQLKVSKHGPDEIDVWIGDYRETYSVADNRRGPLKTQVEVLRKLKERLLQ